MTSIKKLIETAKSLGFIEAEAMEFAMAQQKQKRED